MLKAFQRLQNYIKARRKGQINPHVWFDAEEGLEILRNSPVPGVVMLAVLWMTCTVLLTLSHQKQHDVSDWIVGQRVPYSVISQCNFSYEDKEATLKKRKAERRNAPDFFKIDTRRSEGIYHRFNSFWREIKERSKAENKGAAFAPRDPAVANAVKSCSAELVSFLAAEHLSGHGYSSARERLVRLSSSGIIGVQDKRSRISGKKIKTIDSQARMSSGERIVGDMPDASLAGVWIAEAMFSNVSENRTLMNEFAQIIAGIIGSDGNLQFDPELSSKAAQELEKQVAPVRVSRAKGDLLIRKGDRYTEQYKNILIAHKESMPTSPGTRGIIQHIAWSFVLLIFVVFLVTRLFPKIIRDARRITISTVVIAASLLTNYWALRFFYYLVREGKISSQDFIIDAVPVVLPAVVLTVLAGYRIALCCGFLVVSITAMMIMPDRSFELAMRWMATCAVAGLAVCKVKNYRAYFIRIFVSTVPLVMALSAGSMMLSTGTGKVAASNLLAMFGIASLNGFCSAVAALVLVFILEVVFNIDTDMALMVLSDFSHPLLERLKREAPGTMFHSITVATIAEDAAKAIHANPLRAKVGALFHDIGKLSMPQYFIENNRDSSNEHLKLNPQMSSLIIRDHVKEGLALARDYHLYRWIRGAISTHHGDDLVRYFYNAAQKQRQQSSDASPVIESQFRYTGKPPRAKELVIISLADACEAATRSLTKPTPAKIEALIENIFLTRYQGGQLRNAELSLVEMDIVKRSFIKSLLSIYHGRIAYTTEDSNAEDPVQVEKSESSQTPEK